MRRISMRHGLVTLSLALLSSSAPLPAKAEMLEIDPAESVFAVVTGKAGLAAGLAHDHLVVATSYTARLEHDAAAPEETSFEIELPTASLIVDDPEHQVAWYPRLAALSLVDEPFAELDAKKQAKIRRSMFDGSQLDPENHPVIRASVSSIEPAVSRGGGSSSRDFVVDLALSIKGRTVTLPVTADYAWTGSRLTVQATGAFQFTDFGIKPYSAALGTIKVRDEFQVYVYLAAGPRAHESGSESPPSE